jgi:excinuclease ABC subunit C
LKIFGPYTSKKQLEIALKLIRKIFPFHSNKQPTEKGCLDYQIGRCPGPYAGAISKKDYLKNIRGIEMIFEGKKKYLLKELEKQMREYSKKKEFEKAAETRNRIFALKHIRDVALLTGDADSLGPPRSKKMARIEAYDISNIGGDFAVGSMVVSSGNKLEKSQYRKFKIKTVAGIDDVGMMREVLRRRFQNDWPLPDLIFVDGGKGHLNMAENVVAEFGYDIPVVAVAKGPTRKKVDVYYSKEALAYREIISNNKLVERIREEAHRFAISYHKKLRRKNWGVLRNTN